MDNSEFSNQDLQKMQQEAIRRVNDMQARAKESLKMTYQNNNQKYKNKNSNSGNNNSNISDFQSKNIDTNIINKIEKNDLIKNKEFSNFFDKILKDKETTLIIILILLVIGEDEEIYLIMILVYLLI